MAWLKSTGTTGVPALIHTPKVQTGSAGSSVLHPTIASQHFLGAGQTPASGTNHGALACVWATEALP